MKHECGMLLEHHVHVCTGTKLHEWHRSHNIPHAHAQQSARLGPAVRRHVRMRRCVPTRAHPVANLPRC